MGSIQKILDYHDWAAAMATVIIICVAVSSAALAIYRLCFSPLALAGVPGPKIAAITAWYEFYWDCVQQGRYLFKIEQMHQKYGPYLLFLFIAPIIYLASRLSVSSFMQLHWLVDYSAVKCQPTPKI
jgi:hypothetical protein